MRYATAPFETTISLLVLPLWLGWVAWGGPAPEAGEVDLAAFRQGRSQFPGAAWPVVEDPETLGWSSDRLDQAHRLYEELESSALMVVHRGVPVVSWGPTEKRYNVQSVRKSLLSSLFAFEVAEGRLDPVATLAELGIDDQPPLTATERSARVVDLLRSRSGVVHSALYEVGVWKRAKPASGSHPPGSHWFYSNWDFNALGTIFERSAGEPIGVAFERRIAGPVGMQDFRPGDVAYLTRDSLTEKITGNASDHRAYVFMISARDLARFGLLYLADGRWAGERVLPEEWVERSWQPLPIGESFEEWFGPDVGYGLLWWVEGPDSWAGQVAGGPVYVARGARGHRLVVIPHLELVMTHNVATGGVGLLSQVKRRLLGTSSVPDRDLARLFEKLLAAHPARSG